MTSIMVSKIHSNSHRITKKDLHNFSLRISSESVTPVTSTPYSVAMRSARAPKPQPNSKTFIPGNDGQVAYGDGCGLKIMGKPTETQKSGKKKWKDLQKCWWRQAWFVHFPQENGHVGGSADVSMNQSHVRLGSFARMLAL